MSEGTVPFSNPTTSRAAAESIAPELTELEGKVWHAIMSAGGTGMTCEEVEAHTGLPHQTASARVNGLNTKGQIVDSGRTRKNNSGRQAIVWIAKVVQVMNPGLVVEKDATEARETKTTLMAKYLDLVGLLVPVLDIVKAVQDGGTTLSEAKIAVHITQGINSRVVTLKSEELQAIMDHVNQPLGR